MTAQIHTGQSAGVTSLRNRNSLALIGIVLVTLIVWWPSAQGGFLYWDDNHNIVFNEHVHSLSAENLRWMFFDVGPDIRYKPFGWLAWGIVATIFGVDPFGFHLANLFLHLINTVLVFLLLKRICQLAKPATAEADNDRLPILAAIGSLLWALHPMRVEPVAWISCLPHHLCLAFVLGATLAYLGLDFSKAVWRQRGYWFGAGLFGCALLVFPLPLGYPAVWLALNVFPLKRIRFDSFADAFGRRGLITEFLETALQHCAADQVVIDHEHALGTFGICVTAHGEDIRFQG